jgi:hypothetical protein
MKLELRKANAELMTLATPGPARVEEQQDETIRATLLSLATVSGPLTRPDILAALDAVCPTRKKFRTIGSASSRSLEDKTPIPSLTITGKSLEAAGLRVSKKVTVRIGQDFVLVTVDNPGPDPKVDAEYERIKSNRQQMQDIYDKLMFGRPVREILAYAERMEAEKEGQKKLAET